MDIYSDTDFAALENDIIESYKIEGQNSLDRCIKLSIWQEQLLAQCGGDVQSSTYKKSTVSLRDGTGLTKKQISKDVQVGNYLREHDDESLRDMPKTKIYNTYCKVKKVSPPKVPKPEPIDMNQYQIMQNELECIKDGIRQFRDFSIQGGVNWDKLLTKAGIDPRIFNF